MDTQRKSTRLNDGEQLTLIAQRAVRKEPDRAYVASLKSFWKAIEYSMDLAELEPKAVYDPLGKDKATWSRYASSDAPFPAELILPFQAITLNNAPILWLCHQNGWDIASMRKRLDDKDLEILQLKAEVAKEREEKAVIARFVRENLR